MTAIDVETERWLPVPGYEGHYEVSDLGRVRSLRHLTARGVRGGSVLVPAPRRGPGAVPYVAVHLSAPRRASYLVHRLVLEAFSGPAPAGMESRHLDGDPSNNRLTNLAWGTKSENMLDQVRHGTHGHASKAGCVNGHEFTPENTYRNPANGQRACRACRRAWNRRKYYRDKAARALRQTA